MKNVYGGELEVDLAVGFDAGYFCGGTKTAALSLDSQPYGYRGAIRILREMRLALENPQTHREQMYAAGLVI
jgi:nitrogenase molybdenum-cofactor synthesis protein NifE